MNAKSAKRPAMNNIPLACRSSDAFSQILLMFLTNSPTTLLGEFRLGLAVGDLVASAHRE